MSKADVSSAEVRTVLAGLPVGDPCRYVDRVLELAVAELGTAASRHDTANRYVARLVRAGEQGHTGAAVALDKLGGAFRAAVGADPHRAVDPAEWPRSVSGAVALVKATPTSPAGRGCCGGVVDLIAAPDSPQPPPRNDEPPV